MALRLARQHILNRADPPRLWLVIDETALRRPAATTGASVMRAQIDKLIEAAARPNITVQVLPFAAGLHPAMYGPFRIFRFDAARTCPTSSTASRMTSAWYIDKPDEAARVQPRPWTASAPRPPRPRTTGILTTIRKEI